MQAMISAELAPWEWDIGRLVASHNSINENVIEQQKFSLKSVCFLTNFTGGTFCVLEKLCIIVPNDKKY